MTLYEKPVQLLDARPTMKDEIVLRLGGLYTVIASPIQIYKCSHYKRTLSAYIHTYMALNGIVLEQFFTEMPHLMKICFELKKRIT